MFLLIAFTQIFCGCTSKGDQGKGHHNTGVGDCINKLFELEKNLEVLSPERRKEQSLIQEFPVLEDFWSWAEKAKANGINLNWYIQFILSDIPGSAFLELPEYLDDYMPWNPCIQKIYQ